MEIVTSWQLNRQFKFCSGKGSFMSKNSIIKSIDRENRSLVELAVRCRLITPEQQHAILEELLKELQVDSDFSVLTIFRRRNYISQTNIDFLFIVQDHLALKILDKTFGKLAIANRLTSLEMVEKALDLQSKLFRETRENKLIGEILVANEDISRADRTAVLLTQDRIKDEFLAEAFNELAKSELERIEINKRFGVIAVKNGHVSIHEINQALRQQKLEVKQGNERRYLGEILKEFFQLTEEAVIAILREQKEYEKQRLNLEKALYQYNSEIRMNQKLGQIFEYRISNTKLEAFVVMRSETLGEISPYNLKNWIMLAGIKFSIVDESEIKAFLSTGNKGEEFLIAQGYPPEQGVDGSLEFFFDTEYHLKEVDGDSGPVPFVRKGEIIARRTPHIEGKPGRDVFGNIILQDKVNPCFLGKGKGVELLGDISYVAAIDGNPVLYRERTLFVTPSILDPPLMKIKGDLDSDTLDNYNSCNLEIMGKVCHDGLVTCNHLTVWENVLGEVITSGDVEIKGSLGEGFSPLKPSRKQALVEAQGNVLVSGKMENAKIVTRGSVQAPGADVISCVILAQRGMFLKNVYSSGSGSSILRIGRHETGRMVEISQLLDYKEQRLRSLRYEDKLKALEKELSCQMKLQEEYEERQSALSFLRKMLLNNNIQTETDLSKLLINTKADMDFPRGSRAHEFLNDVVQRFGSVAQNQKQEAVEHLLKKHSEMCRGAVNLTQQLKTDLQATISVIEQSMAVAWEEIKSLEKETADLRLEKDFFSLNQEKGFKPFTPEIKVRNKIEQGTIIKGERSSLVIGQTMYGVKLKEVQDQETGRTAIVVQGYFE